VHLLYTNPHAVVGLRQSLVSLTRQNKLLHISGLKEGNCMSAHLHGRVLPVVVLVLAVCALKLQAQPLGQANAALAVSLFDTGTASRVPLSPDLLSKRSGWLGR